MTTVGWAKGHPTGEVLEEYAFRRLSEADTDSVEEHLLICPACQHALAEIDQYVLLMKHATSQFDLCEHLESESRRWSLGKLARQLPERLGEFRFAMGAAALALSLFLTLALLRPTVLSLPAESVHLQALRGGGADGSEAHKSRPLDVDIDTTGLEVAARYRIDIVDTTGRAEWTGETSGFGDSRLVRLPKGLRAGQHWVRLYVRGELLREFGLRVE